MSLSDIRGRWLKITRSPEYKASDAPRLVVAATFTADPLLPYLGTSYADASGVAPHIVVAPYGQIFQVCLNWQAMFADRSPSAIVILWRIEDMLRSELQDCLRGNTDGVKRALEKVDELIASIASLRRSFAGSIVVSIPPFPHGPDHDIAAAQTVLTAGAFHRQVVGHWASEISKIDGVALLDLDAIQRLIGIERSDDARKWYLYRQPYTEEFWHQAGQGLSRTLYRQRTAAKKCLVVDCDNTMWGGIIGEDGLAGIKLGEDFPGSAFRDFQHQLLTLRSNGVMLAICSKNNENDVWEVFERHDGMVLKREHFVAHRINWLDKPSNIQSLSKELNIGLDSMVFVDDSSIEIEFVRTALPMVECLQVPSDLSSFPRFFGAYRLFDRERISEEDKARSDMMLQERQRQELGTSLSANEFAKALNLAVDVFAVKAEHIARVTQLINKTNQFNLTTRRLDAGEVANLSDAPDVGLLAWRVADRFGDYGLVGVLILRHGGDIIDIDSFLMSCRVLGRGVENAVFAAIADFARSVGATRLRGEYIPTPKNVMVANLYRDHGFEAMSERQWVSSDLTGFSWPDHISRPGL